MARHRQDNKASTGIHCSTQAMPRVLGSNDRRASTGTRFCMSCQRTHSLKDSRQSQSKLSLPFHRRQAMFRAVPLHEDRLMLQQHATMHGWWRMPSRTRRRARMALLLASDRTTDLGRHEERTSSLARTNCRCVCCPLSPKARRTCGSHCPMQATS